MIGNQQAESTLVLGTITGYRVWMRRPLPTGYKLWTGETANVYDNIDWQNASWGRHSKLYSCSQKHAWKVEKTTAICEMQYQKAKSRYAKHDHKDSPNPKCSCGLYGFYSTYNVRQSFSSSLFDPHASTIAGAFTAWGNTVLGSKGFRCQYAKISALVKPFSSNPKSEHLVRHIASYYGVPMFDNFTDLEIAFPQSNLSNLL